MSLSQPNTKITITFLLTVDTDPVDILCYNYTFIMGCIQIALDPIADQNTGELEMPQRMKFFPMMHVHELSIETIKPTEIN